MIRRFVLTVVALALATARMVGTPMASDLMQPTEAATKAEVLKHIPIGTPIEQAKMFMDANGFKCLAMQIRNLGKRDPLLDSRLLIVQPISCGVIQASGRSDWSCRAVGRLSL